MRCFTWAIGQNLYRSNAENASYGLVLCEESTAVFKAVSEGEREFQAIANVTKNGGMPCGACRLNEFRPEMSVIALDDQLNIHLETTLDRLLPEVLVLQI